jgi:hypothetical protein
MVVVEIVRLSHRRVNGGIKKPIDSTCVHQSRSVGGAGAMRRHSTAPHRSQLFPRGARCCDPAARSGQRQIVRESGPRSRLPETGSPSARSVQKRHSDRAVQFDGAGGICAARGRGNSIAMKTSSGLASVT